MQLDQYIKQSSKPINVKISVVGLGLLGTLLATGFANNKHKVVAIDKNSEKVQNINQGLSPIQDKELQLAVEKARSLNNLLASSDLHNAILQTDVTMICIGRAKQDKPESLSDDLQAICQQIGDALSNKLGYHLVLLHCSLRPDICEKQAVPIIEKWSKKQCGKDFGLCYLPLNLVHTNLSGKTVMHDSILHGSYDKRSAKLAASLYSSLDIGLKSVRLTVDEQAIS